MWRSLFLALTLAVLPAQASAFGTIAALGQDREHERITRSALADFSPNTLDMIAGKRGTFGAIGAPDRPGRGLLSNHAAHCDGGDYLDVEGYRQSRAVSQRILESCRAWMARWIEEAVTAAAPLEHADARSTELDCHFDGRPRRAKCAVIEYLGLALHASQDFYSHSNWVDRAQPGALSITNPPGLGHTGRAPWIDLRAESAFPRGLISGCYDGFPEAFYCRDRIRHEVLSKDNGPIGPHGARGPGSTSRGSASGNFERAVGAAMDDTRDKWRYFQQRLIAVYGRDQGRYIACVVRKDDYRTC